MEVGYNAWGAIKRVLINRGLGINEKKCLYDGVIVTRIERVMHEEELIRAGIKRELASCFNQRLLKWFGHLERMDKYRITKMVLMTKVSGGRVRGRPRLGRMDGM